MNGNDADLIENTLMFFEGRCGHQWVGATGGAFACPLCGDADGDNHLTKMQAISVQRMGTPQCRHGEAPPRNESRQLLC